MNIKTFLTCVQPVADTRVPVMIRGAHGIGKSEIVYMLAKQMGLPMIERRASQMTEGDLCGMPKVEGKCTSWLPPDFYMEACDKPVCLFLDELDRALREVRQGFFELADSRKLNGHVLHPDTVLFTAINGGPTAKNYQVFEMGPAETDRWWIVDLDPTLEDWLTWATSKRGGEEADKDDPKVHALITDFLDKNPEFLEHKQDFEPSVIYPSRRSWKRCSDVLATAGLYEEMDADLMFYLVDGFCGIEAATALREFVLTYKFAVTVEEFLKGGASDRMKDFAINDHTSFLRKFENSGVVNERELTKAESQVVLDYFMVLPSELCLQLVSIFAKQNNHTNNFLNLADGYATDGGKDLSDYLLELYEGENEVFTKMAG